MEKQSPLRVNIGFIIHEAPGYTRVFEFEYPELVIEEDTPIQDLKGEARFSRTHQGILLEVTATGTLPAECVRCLEGFEQELSIDFKELYQFDPNKMGEEEHLVPENGYVDLKPMVREYLLLDMPVAPLCKPDCAGLCPVCGVNHNHESCDCDHTQIDSRLAKLKDLLDQQKEE